MLKNIVAPILSLIMFALTIRLLRNKQTQLIPGTKIMYKVVDFYQMVMFIPFVILVGVFFMLPGEKTTTWFPQYN
jgi:nitrogen fixation/metabolism regulation signal transduction histidine kinase